MPQINTPNYDVIKSKVTRCLKAWYPEYTEKDEAVAFAQLDKLWPDVQWTNGNYIIKAFQDAARFAIDKAKHPPLAEMARKKRRVRPPKSSVVDEREDKTEDEIALAEVDQSIKIES